MNKKLKTLSSLLLTMSLLSNTAFAGTYTVTTKEQLFNALSTDIKNYDSNLKITFGGNVTPTLVSSWLKEALMKLGDFGNITHGYSGSYTYDGAKYTGNFVYNYHITKQQYDQVVEYVRGILPSIVNEQMDIIQKEKAIHDWIINNVEYDHTYTNYDAYDAIFGNRTTVCNGYAMLANIMFNEAGIPSVVVVGMANGGSKTEAHAWNLVNINGNWYHVDATWDDGGANGVRYDYFNLRTEEIKKNHFPTSIYPATSKIPFEQLLKDTYGADTSKYSWFSNTEMFDKINTFDDLMVYLKGKFDAGVTEVKFAYKGSLTDSQRQTLYKYIYKFQATGMYNLNKVRYYNTGYNVYKMYGIYREPKDYSSNILLKFRQTSKDVRMNSTYDLKELLNIYPLGYNNVNLTWTSSNQNVVKVENGVVTPVAPGSTTIKVALADTPNVYQQITIKVPVDVQSISAKTPEVTMNVGASLIPQLVITPTNATYKTFTMVSSDSNVVEVSGNYLKAKAEGKATITMISTDNPSAKTTMTVTVINPVKTITVSKTSTIIKVGQSESLTATVNEDATDKTVLWASSNTKVATVDETGKITAISPGTAQIKVYSKTNPNVSKTISVTVPVDLKGISISTTEVYVKVGSTYTPTITFNPINATIKNVTYTSDNTSVLAIENGKPTAKATGTANLTVTAQDGGYKVVIKVNVISTPLTSIALNKTSTTLSVGGSESLTVTYNPTNASVKDVTWSSSNTSVATIDVNGKITAVGKGTATIKVVSKQNPSLYKTCTVYVK